MFVITSFVNMMVYPGGYSFFGNYFSELGLIEVGPYSNLLGYVLFSFACTAAAVCSVPFWLSIRMEFTSSNSLRYTSLLGSILGLTAAPNLSALALFAADVFLREHILTTISFFLLYTFAIIVYSLAILMNKEYSNLYSLVGFAVAVVVFGHIFFIGTALMQKLAVYSLILWSAVQGYAILKKMKQLETPADG